MSDILQRIVEHKRRRLSELGQQILAASEHRCASDQRDFAAALRQPGLSIIAEFKRRSPSRGAIAANADPAHITRNYQAAGAAALSILTDEEFFGGSNNDLLTARAATELPVLRKDFTLDPIDVHEAWAIGADAVLLIVAILDDETLSSLLALATKRGLAAIVEVHDENEVRRAVAAGAELIGVNNRDLRTFEVSLETSLRLRPLIPAGCLAISESGIHSASDARRLKDAGFDALLVGESLLTSPDPGGALRELRGASK